MQEVYFNGSKYRLMGSGRYYLRIEKSMRDRIGVKGLHVDVWEFYSGKKVPKGYIVHHKDENPLNNDFLNLECISAKEHAQKHKNDRWKDSIKLAIEAAKEWHRSEDGRAWHSEHAKEIWENAKPKAYECAFCEKSFESMKQSGVLFCGHNCRQKHYDKNNVHNELRKCHTCGKDFWTNRAKKTLNCSRSCANTMNNLKRYAKG